ncbi:hypothetical protein CLV28_1507 [Sediminihabitans luteus]|uniref:TIGR01777 family protein n=1 Tax=Sediminihabitans luteus TaxID=1138585 RepID=A0A2M9CQA0_9CELL|nr:TIGR01777 family oxidoreductase [Sediminihabitans luteus]PJJ74018.1 hypothetical protein CLV28_1507 [Sediminihabitans luteus]GII98067.1 epimerase [Sediminihabitans luteus]
MDIVVAGSHGLIGSALVERLHEDGHTVRRLVRGTPRAADERAWDPAAGQLDPAHLEGADAVVNVGGAGVGDHRWSAAYKRTILDSRVAPTRLLATTITALEDPPRVMLQGSAVGFYGDRGDDVLTEDDGPGQGFLAGVVQRWEAATAPAQAAGVRVVHARSGIVLSPAGGALGRLLPLIRLGVAGPLGSGRQWWPWITLPDEVSALVHLLTSDLAGPVNLAAPTPATNKDLTRALAAALHRPAVVPVPGVALRVALGEFATTLQDSQRMVPAALEADGFRFEHADVDAAARWVASR